MASSGPQSVDASGLASGLPTAVGDGWYLVGHMTNAGGMFDGNSNLSSTYSYGNYSNNPYGTSDFYRAFPVNPDEVLFITGNNQYWGRVDYDDLKAVIDAKANDYTASFNWTVSTDGVTERSVNGSVLSRPSYFDREDPWIALEGGHNIDSGAYNLMLWGESNYSAHTTLKNQNEGVNLYVRSLNTVSIEPLASSFNEGGKAIFQINTAGFVEGSSLSYSLSGVSSSDIVGGATSGSFTVGAGGQATISIPLSADAVTEGNETLTLSSQGVSSSVTVVDSSRTPGSTQPQSVNAEGQASGLPSAVGDGWYLVARMAPGGGMFDGNSNLSSTYSYGTYPNNPYASQDFYRSFPVDAQDILFISGDNQYWARTDYALLKAKIDAQGGDYNDSFQWLTSKDGVTESNVSGSILSRTNYIDREDPWIALEGEHGDEIALGRTSSSAAFSLMLWGESDYYAHTFLKSTYDGVNVYVRPEESNQPTPPPVISTPPSTPPKDNLALYSIGITDSSLENGDSLEILYEAEADNITFVFRDPDGLLKYFGEGSGFLGDQFDGVLEIPVTTLQRSGNWELIEVRLNAGLIPAVNNQLMLAYRADGRVYEGTYVSSNFMEPLSKLRFDGKQYAHALDFTQSSFALAPGAYLGGGDGDGVGPRLVDLSVGSKQVHTGDTLKILYSWFDATGIYRVAFQYEAPDGSILEFESDGNGVAELTLTEGLPNGHYSLKRVALIDSTTPDEGAYLKQRNRSLYDESGSIQNRVWYEDLGYFDSRVTSPYIWQSSDPNNWHFFNFEELDFEKGPASNYILVADSDYFDEGEIATFTLSTTNVEEGTSVNYTLSGISPSDVKAGLSGKVEIDANGQALIAISILADSKTEGDETLTVTVEDQSVSVLIRDTSKNPAGVTPGKRANSSANEKFEAASGETKLEFAGNSDNFKVRSNDGGKTWELSSPDTGTDTVTGFKRIALDDKTIALDFQAGDAGYSSVMLIGAAFGKDLVPTYFSAGLTFFDAGLDTAYLCDLIQSAGLIESQIGQTSTGAWIKHVYKNVVGVFPDELTELVFTDLIDSGVYTRATLLKAAAELSLLESQVDITGLQSTGLTYTPFG